jgi:hypothetical protein
MKALNYSKLYALRVYMNEIDRKSSFTLVLIWMEYFLEAKDFRHEAETY